MDTRNRVMGISTGTRTVGIAIFKDGKLWEWQLKTFTGKWSKIKQKWILSTVKQIIVHYDVSSIAIKVPHASRTSKALNELTKAIQNLAEKKDLPIETLTLKEMEQAFPCATKEAMIEQLANQFPELEEYYEKAIKKYKSPSKNLPSSSFEKMFEAVALALLLNE